MNDERDSIQRMGVNLSPADKDRLFSLLLLAVLGFIGVVVYMSIPETSSLVKNAVAFVDITVASAVLFVMLFNHLRHRKRAIEMHDDDVRYEGYYDQARKAFGETENRIYVSGETYSYAMKRDPYLDRTVAGMMANNVAMTRVFHEDTARGGRAAFVLAAIMCTLGIVVVVATIILFVLGKIDAGIAMASTVGGLLSEVGGVTTMSLQKRSSEQADRHFLALHENERTLYALGAVNRIRDSDKRDDALASIACKLVDGLPEVGDCVASDDVEDGGSPEERFYP